MAGYSEKSLINKLGLRPGMSTYFLHAPHEYIAEIGVHPRVADEESGYDFIHVFYTKKSDLENYAPFLASKLAEDGMLWVSWPKKSSGVESDLTEQDLRDILLPEGLVDIKVCAVTNIWSALKFVWRKK